MNTTPFPLVLSSGNPFPLGCTYIENSEIKGWNFSLFVSHAISVRLCLFVHTYQEPYATFDLDPKMNLSGQLWHIAIKNLPEGCKYAYQIFYSEKAKNSHRHCYLLDPYAKEIFYNREWGQEGKVLGKKYHFQPLGVVFTPKPFDWENDRPLNLPMSDLVIYEMHIRGFSKDRSATTVAAGTFSGMIDKIPHLKNLGINAVEFLPIHSFDDGDNPFINPLNHAKLVNYWGYSTINFFAPMVHFAHNTLPGGPTHEFKTLVKELHKAGIEVILDVVFNHTAEGNEAGPVFSFKALDIESYYLLTKKREFINDSGCGNTLNCNHPITHKMIVDSLHYYVTEFHVDGFRFDLASILTRGENGVPQNLAPLLRAIVTDPLLSSSKLIVEPWDAAGLYQIGFFAHFSNRFHEWNGKYRDVVRRFIKGDANLNGEFATALCGSEWTYKNVAPTASINFITSHDGFTLRDLVTYEHKHNIENGEENRDGFSFNDAWNCGIEGPTENKKILQLRDRQMKNFHLALMLSLGIPMLHMGDEYGHTKKGNNNTWGQDNRLNWFLWEELEKNQDFFRFYKGMIQFRNECSLVKRPAFFSPAEVDWHGEALLKPNWNTSNFIAVTLKDLSSKQALYIAFNAQDKPVSVELPTKAIRQSWEWVANTSLPSPLDFYEKGNRPPVTEDVVKMLPYSSLLIALL